LTRSKNETLQIEKEQKEFCFQNDLIEKQVKYEANFLFLKLNKFLSIISLEEQQPIQHFEDF